jgi:hypothetical protein
LARTGKVGQS